MAITIGPGITITGGMTFEPGALVPAYGLWTWGRNPDGRLLQNDRIYRSSPTQVGTATNWSMVSTGWYTTMATKTDGTLWIAGDQGGSGRGALGLNDQSDRSSPTQIGTGTTWNLICATWYQGLATKTDGTLWTWGYNIYGNQGLNDLVDRSSPVQIGSGTTWNLITAGQYSIMATRTDGTLWTWGRNHVGQLGQNDLVNRSSPVQIGSGTTWNKISGGLRQAAATRTDGTLWAWGDNSDGGLGQNNRTYRSSPVQVGTGTTWKSISAGSYGTLVATKTDGTLWLWGRNNYGQLGQNDLVNRSSPVQLGSGTTWDLISANSYTVFATRTDGTLWSWGREAGGSLGQNDTIYRSSPVQVGTATNWASIVAGRWNSVALRIA